MAELFDRKLSTRIMAPREKQCQNFRLKESPTRAKQGAMIVLVIF
ncbi:MAG: hypothetical protein P8M30_09965 [Planctomycetaceae bacterium]|nr:hypothetical protein [Planctomycetaceae bacterium]